MNGLTIRNSGTTSWVGKGAALTLAVFLLFAVTASVGCSKGGPTGPSEDSCASLTGGNPVGSWRHQKDAGWIMEYKPDGAFVSRGTAFRGSGRYAVEGNKLREDWNPPNDRASGWFYFEVVGNVLTSCASNKSFYWDRI